MNLDSINSVNDLIEANKTPDYQKQIDAILEEAVRVDGLKSAMAVALTILSRIEDVHDTVADELMDEQREEAQAWAHDGSKLCIAQSLLRSIERD